MLFILSGACASAPDFLFELSKQYSDCASQPASRAWLKLPYCQCHTKKNQKRPPAWIKMALCCSHTDTHTIVFSSKQSHNDMPLSKCIDMLRQKKLKKKLYLMLWSIFLIHKITLIFKRERKIHDIQYWVLFNCKFVVIMINPGFVVIYILKYLYYIYYFFTIWYLF